MNRFSSTAVFLGFVWLGPAHFGGAIGAEAATNQAQIASFKGLPKGGSAPEGDACRAGSEAGGLPESLVASLTSVPKSTYVLVLIGLVVFLGVYTFWRKRAS